MHGAQPPTTRPMPSGVTRPGEVGAAGGGGAGGGGRLCVCVWQGGPSHPSQLSESRGEPGRSVALRSIYSFPRSPETFLLEGEGQ